MIVVICHWNQYKRLMIACKCKKKIVVCDSRQLSTEGNWSNLAQFWRSNWIPLSQFRITLRLIVQLLKAFGSKNQFLLHVLSMMPLAFRVTQDKKINKPSVFKKITTRSVFSTAPLLMICDQKPHFVVDFFKSCITRAGSLCWSLQVSTLRGVTDFESNFGSCSYFTHFFHEMLLLGKLILCFPGHPVISKTR